MAGQREILAGFAGVIRSSDSSLLNLSVQVRLEDVRGIRAPFLAIGGNNMFR